MLTPLARPAFEGPSPLNLIDANTRGTGKSLSADVVSTVLTGRPAARMSYSRDEDEIRKSITGLALEAAQLVLIDNVSGVFGSPTLDRALTAWTWCDRILGSNDQVELPLPMTWYATGNNVALHRDTPRRCLHVRLESPEERPEERTVFRHPQLLPWVRRHRGRVLSAALTLLRAYVVAGRPAQGLPVMGSFESWSDLVRSAIVWRGLPDPAVTRNDLELAAGSEVGLLAGLLEGLEELFGVLGRQATARQMVEAFSADDNKERFVALRASLREHFPAPQGRRAADRRSAGLSAAVLQRPDRRRPGDRPGQEEAPRGRPGRCVRRDRRPIDGTPRVGGGSASPLYERRDRGGISGEGAVRQPTNEEQPQTFRGRPMCRPVVGPWPGDHRPEGSHAGLPLQARFRDTERKQQEERT